MGYRRVLALAAIALAGQAPAAEAAQRPDFDLGPEPYAGVAVEQDVPITMRDGVRLFADVLRPADAQGRPIERKLPVLIVQTPYSKGASTGGYGFTPGSISGFAGKNELAVRHGYVQVIVDVRGTGASEGSWDSFGEAEQRDSLEILEWARKAPWSDGRIGLTGPSYMAITALLTASKRPRGLKALFPIIPAEDIYRDIVYHGGGLDAGFMPLWLGLVTGLKMLPPTWAGSDPAKTVPWAGERVTGTQWAADAAARTTTGGDLAFDGPFYALRSPGKVIGRIRVPTFITGGWFDLFQRGEPRLYQRLRLKPGRKQLLMGPWYHVTAGDGLTGKDGSPPPLDVLAVAWFDRWIKGVRNGIENFGPVTLYELGRERWTSDIRWPRPGVRHQRLYLDPTRSGSARSLNDGSLSGEAPKAAGSASGEANLLNGLCLRSTIQWTAGAVPGGQCESDNRLYEASAFTFTTAPADGDMHLSGPIGLKLRGATTARDTTWVAVLSDVAPDGRSTQLTAGWLISSRRALDLGRSVRAANGDVVVPWHPFTAESLLPVGFNKPEDLDIEIFNTDAVIAKGHRLRLTIASGDVPHLLAPAPVVADQAGAVNSVHWSPQEPSFLTVPLLAR